MYDAPETQGYRIGQLYIELSVISHILEVDHKRNAFDAYSWLGYVKLKGPQRKRVPCNPVRFRATRLG